MKFRVIQVLTASEAGTQHTHYDVTTLDIDDDDQIFISDSGVLQVGSNLFTHVYSITEITPLMESALEKAFESSLDQFNK